MTGRELTGRLTPAAHNEGGSAGAIGGQFSGDTLTAEAGDAACAANFVIPAHWLRPR